MGFILHSFWCHWLTFLLLSYVRTSLCSTLQLDLENKMYNHMITNDKVVKLLCRKERGRHWSKTNYLSLNNYVLHLLRCKSRFHRRHFSTHSFMLSPFVIQPVYVILFYGALYEIWHSKDWLLPSLVTKSKVSAIISTQ